MANGKGMPKDYKFVDCRLLKHSWVIFTDNESDATVDLECSRCSCLRHDWIVNTGALKKRRYEYPDGYILTREERPNAEALRRSLLARLRASKR